MFRNLKVSRSSHANSIYVSAMFNIFYCFVRVAMLSGSTLNDGDSHSYQEVLTSRHQHDVLL